MASSNEWYNLLQKAKKSSIINDKIKRVRYEFDNGDEMMEEYNTDTNIVIRRAWKKDVLSGKSYWQVEIGEPIVGQEVQTETLMTENLKEPIVTRRVTRINLEWRIRNMPYSIDNYKVTAESDNTITIRTENKKYFKKLQVPELDRACLKPEQDRITVSHQYQTLIITYKKPQALMDLDKAVLKLIQDVETVDTGAVGIPAILENMLKALPPSESS